MYRTRLLTHLLGHYITFYWGAHQTNTGCLIRPVRRKGLIGTWTGTVYGAVNTFEFRADSTCTYKFAGIESKDIEVWEITKDEVVNNTTKEGIKERRMTISVGKKDSKGEWKDNFSSFYYLGGDEFKWANITFKRVVEEKN